MTSDDGIQQITLCYVHDDNHQRREFDRRIAVFLRTRPAHHRWDITPLVDALDQLGRRIPGIEVSLRHDPARAELQASLDFALPRISEEEP